MEWALASTPPSPLTAGAAIRTYLLERSRVVNITDPERNYHVFYQVGVWCDSLRPAGRLGCNVEEGIGLQASQSDAAFVAYVSA